ncbi:MAG: DUF559 domain-containing protein, partial [Planctomycetota bacterium]
LGWWVFRPRCVRERIHVIKTVTVNERPCTTLSQLSALSAALQVRIAFDKAWRCWRRNGDPAKEPFTQQLALLTSLRDVLRDVLSLESPLTAARDALARIQGLPEPSWTDETELQRLLASCNVALARARKRSLADQFQRLVDDVAAVVDHPAAPPFLHELLTAISGRDISCFTRLSNRLSQLEQKRSQWRDLNTALAGLRQHLPRLIDEIERTYDAPDWDDRISHIVDAWRWAQARNWLEDYIRCDQLPALLRRAKQIDDEINSTIADLAALRAWSYCFSRLTESHCRHMEAWRQATRRLGKGTGKYAAKHRRDAQQHLAECKDAVPAWVMPLHRIWDTVPAAPEIFDVIIVDEASQCGLESLPLLYLTKKIIIVGDDKQISPEAVGVRREDIETLKKHFLHDFTFASSFDVESSLFDHGKLRYSAHRITLREHFRCMPEIIRFSNELCYRDTPLIPLRQYGTDRLPPLEHVYLPKGYREGTGSRVVNKPEADAVVDRIVAMCNDPRFDGKTMGVIVLQGETQGRVIEQALLERLGAEEFERRRLLCGNPYSFQGDERDIIFLSMVAAPNERIGPLTKAADERRFNVAASRARDMMILFHSVTRDDLSESDLRRRLLEFFEDTHPQEINGIDLDDLERHAACDNRQIVKPPKPFESWFEVDVALQLLRKNYSVVPQYEVSKWRIDLVVEGARARLAVECDGDHWHGADQYEKDMQRQRQLERCGWEFFRVRESAFYTDQKKALADLWELLESRGIYPMSRRKPDISGEEQEARRLDETSTDCCEIDIETSSDTAQHNLANNVSAKSERRLDQITKGEVQAAIQQALAKCPNFSCTIKSLTARVLKELEIVTRGRPRRRFERRVLAALKKLEEQGVVEKYKAKNERVRLLRRGRVFEQPSAGADR